MHSNHIDVQEDARLFGPEFTVVELSVRVGTVYGTVTADISTTGEVGFCDVLEVWASEELHGLSRDTLLELQAEVVRVLS